MISSRRVLAASCPEGSSFFSPQAAREKTITIAMSTHISRFILLSFLCPVINELYICPNLGGQLNILYEKKFRNATNTFWIIGGGVCGAKDLAKGITSPYWKTGVRLVWGIEWCFDFPLSIQLDTRQGYGLFFSSDKNFDGSENPLFFTFGHVPFHFYDFSLVFSVRYCFGKNDKNNQ